MATKITLDLSPARVDLKLVRGDTWRIQFFFPYDPNAATPVGVPLGGSEWTAHVKLSEDALINDDPATAIFGTFAIDTIHQNDGYLYLSLGPEVTRLAIPGEFYWYDLQQERLGTTATPIQGRIRVMPDVTIEDGV